MSEAGLDWEAIETAPKVHGQEVLLWCTRPERVFAVMWLSADNVDHDLDLTPGWYLSDGHNDPIWFRAHPYVTHWRLPPPPPTPRTA